MPKIRVAIVQNLPVPYRVHLFRRLLDSEEYDVRIFFTGKPSAVRPYWSYSRLPEDPRVSVLSNVSLPMLGLGADNANLNFGIGKVFRGNPDIVLIFGHQDPTNMLIAALCRWKKIPYILFSEISYGYGSSARSRIGYPLVRFMVRGATRLVPASQSCEQFFRSVVPDSDNMSIIPCVADVLHLTAVSSRLSKRRDQLTEKYGVGDRVALLFVGRLVETKGIMDILTALEMMPSELDYVTLNVVGTGPLDEEIRLKADVSDSRIIYHGAVNDEELHELYSVSDLLMMPSWAEPYGVVCSEALSFGVPVLVTRTSGCSDLVKDAVNGFVIEPRCPRSIADAIERVMSDKDLRDRMKENASSTISHLTSAYLTEQLKREISEAVEAGWAEKTTP